MTWRDGRFTDLVGVDLPIVQAPMAGAQDEALAIAAAQAGALASLPCAMLDADGVRRQVAAFRATLAAPLNLNFFCHTAPAKVDDTAWRAALQPYYAEHDIGYPAVPPPPRRAFDPSMCAVVGDLRPEVVSFHFGLPDPALLHRVRATGALIFGCGTSPAEARWLAERGVDAIVAQGWEAGGHAGRFLPADPSSHMGTLALVPQVVDAVRVPVIAAGGIADGRGMAAALVLGAAAVQLGTVYLRTPESRISAVHRDLLGTNAAGETVSTNVFTGRHARGLPTRLTRELGPISPIAPPFPHAGDALTELRKADPRSFANMWAGQAAALARAENATAVTLRLAREAQELLP